MFSLINITSCTHALKHLGTSLTVKTLKDLFQSANYSGNEILCWKLRKHNASWVVAACVSNLSTRGAETGESLCPFSTWST